MTFLHRLSVRASALLGLLFLAGAAHAQTNTSVPNTAGADKLGQFLLSFIYLFDRYVVPLIFSIAFIVFLWGVYTYFIAGAANEEKRQEGQKFVMSALIGFVIMLCVWGIVSLLVNTLGFGTSSRPDLPTFTPSGSGTSNTNTLPTAPTNTTNTNTSNTNTTNTNTGGGGAVDVNSLY